jgi:hypothetical protein
LSKPAAAETEKLLRRGAAAADARAPPAPRRRSAHDVCEQYPVPAAAAAEAICAAFRRRARATSKKNAANQKNSRVGAKRDFGEVLGARREPEVITFLSTGGAA